MKMAIQSLSIISTLITISVSLAFAGGVDTGGGTGVRNSVGEMEVLDFVNFGDKNIISRFSNLNYTVEDQKVIISETLVEKISLRRLPHYRSMLARLNWWAKLPDQQDILSKIKYGMDSIQIQFVDRELNIEEIGDTAFHSGRSYQNDEFEVLAVYNKNHGVVISRSKFNSLNSYQQETLLFHEVLRELQIGQGYGFTEGALQLLTVSLMEGPRSDFVDLNELVQFNSFKK